MTGLQTLAIVLVLASININLYVIAKELKKMNKEQKDNGFFDEIMDDSEDGEVYEKIKEIIAKVKEQEDDMDIQN